MSPAATLSRVPTNPYRLPRSVIPSHYDLRLTPDLDAGTFAGRVRIAANATEAASQVLLNAADLAVAAATVNGVPCPWSVDSDTERLVLDCPVAAGPVEVVVEFEGRFNEQLVGFYLSRFELADGSPGVLAATQFEATHARKCFPCWDEPDFKASFGIELVVQAGHDAIANSSEVDRQSHDDGSVVVRFAPTMVMSTYLVAFVVGPLEMTEPVDVNGTPLRIVHVPGKSHLTGFALESGAFALDYFANYFDVPYPGDKVDMVAIPDFAFGAMENLGCITFRETLLLVDPNQSTQPELQRVADVIHHELAHMWFGDLVTMKWWNGLWLNEAFATFMEMKCTDAFRPDWKRWVDFGISRSEAFDVDSLASTRPIEFTVVSPTDAEGMFDALTYEKGAAVVRMLEQHLGEASFQAGIRRYMRQHAYGNAETTDLWDAIESETGEPVRRMMDSWIFQGGYPLVSVGLSPDGRSVTFTQERFGFVGGDVGEAREWVAPLRFRWKPAAPNSAPRTEKILIDGPTVTIQLDEPADWLVANAEGASFLRVAYPSDVLERLAEVAVDALLPTERYALADDAWAAVLADRMTAASFLSLVETLSVDDDRSVWQRLITGLGSLDRLLDGTPRESFQSVVHDAVAPALAGIGLTPLPVDDDRTRQLRGDLIRAMGVLANDLEIQQEAQRTVAEGRRNPELVDAAVLAAALAVTSAIGDEADYEDFLASSRAATTPQEEIRYLMALADFPDFDLVARLFPAILAGDVRSQNAPYWLGRALTNRVCGADVWRFVADNWDVLNELFPSGSIVRMVAGVATLTEPAQVSDVQAFFDRHPVPQGATTLAQILERQRVGASLRARESGRLSRLFE